MSQARKRAKRARPAPATRSRRRRKSAVPAASRAKAPETAPPAAPAAEPPPPPENVTFGGEPLADEAAPVAHPAPHTVAPAHLAAFFTPGAFRRESELQIAPAPPPAPALDRFVDFASRRSTHMALGFLLLFGVGLVALARTALGLPVDLSMGLGPVLVAAVPGIIAQVGYSAQHFARAA